MNDILTLIISSTVSLIVGGGLTGILTARSVKTKARADAMQSVQDVYQETINDLRKDRSLQREEFTAQIQDLKARIEEMRRDVDNLKKLRCYKLDCPERQGKPCQQ